MEEKIHSFLVEWTANYLKSKDAIARKIERIEHGKDSFDLFVKYKDKEQYVLVCPVIIDFESVIGKLKTDTHYLIVMLNSIQNLQVILKNWSKIVNFKFVSLVFVNPFSSEKKWILMPYTHHRICDESSLELGLKSMFDLVGQVDERAFDGQISLKAD